MQKGFGLQGQESLSRLCKMLWMKSSIDEEIFDHFFFKMISKWKKELKDVEIKEVSNKFKNNVKAEIEKKDQAESANPSTLPNTPNYDDYNRNSEKHTKLEKADKISIDINEIPVFYEENQKKNRNISFQEFTFSHEYFPVNERQMKQSWRFLRLLSREGIPVEFDILKTIKKMNKSGYLHKPVLIPKKINKFQLILFIDQQGSMVPFHILSRQLITTAIRSGRLKSKNIYYFYNFPRDNIYNDTGLIHSKSIKAVLRDIHPFRTGILIFSDAGAARGRINKERIVNTYMFLKQIKNYIRNIVWLNPMPEKRWIETTAYEIAKRVQMFDFSNNGFIKAIKYLRGNRSLPRKQR